MTYLTFCSHGHHIVDMYVTEVLVLVLSLLQPINTQTTSSTYETTNITQRQNYSLNTTTLNSTDSLPETTTALTTTTEQTTTTTFVPADVLDYSLPIPKKLMKLSATTSTLILRFRPPTNYRNDDRYNQFRIEYKTNGRERSREVAKSSDPNRLILPDLQSGVLYMITIRTQGRDALGNYLLSRTSNFIKARTVPSPISNLRVVRPKGSLTEVMVMWDGTPTPFNGPKYDKFVLSCQITNRIPTFQANQLRKNPITIPHNTGVLLNAAPPKNISQTVKDLELGATYRFTVVTVSTGEDSSSSTKTSTSFTLTVPGPLDLTKTNFTTSSLTIAWRIDERITGVTGHILQYQSVLTPSTLGPKSEEIDLSAEDTEFTITSLKPGVLYYVVVKCNRSLSLLGKESEESMFYARTLPSSPQNVTIIKATKSAVELAVRLPNEAIFSTIIIETDVIEPGGKRYRDRTYDNLQESIIIEQLSPGALYRFSVTVVSEEGLKLDITNKTMSIIERTVPNEPINLTGVATQGRIVLQWIKPDGLQKPMSWMYKITYYPQSNPNLISRLSVWNRDGVTKMTHSIDRLLPGTMHEIYMYCEVGKDTENDKMRRSSTIGPLLLYTQPKNPSINQWIQVTLTQIKLEWMAPGQSVSNFDYYLLNLTRLYNQRNSVEYAPEEKSFDVDKYDTEKIISLTPGASYRVALTTVVGNGSLWMQSVVNSSNSRVIDTWSPYDSHQLFSRLIWRFSSCDVIGRFGPNQLMCDVEYEDSSLEKLVTVSEGIQYWIAPMEGLYRITAVGAGYEGQGGKGATVSGLFHLKEGSRLKIAVGQRGDYDGEMTQGGAGGTFVVADDTEKSNEPMVIAGGAGTCVAGKAPSNISNARLNHTAADASSFGQGYGYGGQRETRGPGLPGILNTAGGAGFKGISLSKLSLGDKAYPAVGFLPFDEEVLNETERLLYIPLVGGLYETEDNSFSEGGFGGGGSGYRTAAGGGGGYTGGGGGSPGGHSGGGGSYIKFTGGTQYAEMMNNGLGSVTITLVGLPKTSPIPVTLYLVVAFFVGVGMTLCCGGMLFCVDKRVGRYIEKSHDKRKGHYTVNTDIGTSITRTPAPIPPSIALYETNVANCSPGSSALYVRNTNVDGRDLPTHVHLDSDSSVTSDTEMPSHGHSYEVLGMNSEPPKKTFTHVNGVAYYEDDDSIYIDDGETESTASTISSMRYDDIDLMSSRSEWYPESTVDAESNWNDNDSLDDETDRTTVRAEDSDDSPSLPPPPPPPPIEELASEEQRKLFRQKLQMFHAMQNPK